MESLLKKNGILFIGVLLLAAIIACSDETGPAATIAAPKTSAMTGSGKPIASEPSLPADGPVNVPQLQPSDDPVAEPSPFVSDRSTFVLDPQENRLVDCGTSEFGRGAKTERLPLRCIRANYGFDGPSGPPTIAPQQPIKVESYYIPSRLRESLAAYWMNLGGNEHGVLLLAPKDWSLFSANVGANGSHSIRLVHPDDPEQFIDYFDQGGCQGCLIPNIGTYFPQLKSWAEEQGYEVDPSPGIIESTMLTPNLVAYRKQTEKSGYALHGVAYQEHGNGSGVFRSEKVQLTASDKAAATVILNLFVALHRDSLK